jgi:hypothetical protein
VKLAMGTGSAGGASSDSPGTTGALARSVGGTTRSVSATDGDGGDDGRAGFVGEAFSARAAGPDLLTESLASAFFEALVAFFTTGFFGRADSEELAGLDAFDAFLAVGFAAFLAVLRDFVALAMSVHANVSEGSLSNGTDRRC